MKVFITVLIFIFSLQSWIKADDISDFQIEGMSIGDSLLDYFSEEKINKSKRNYGYTSKKFYTVGFDNETFFKVYEALEIGLKANDKNYIIYSISGVNYFINDINNCYKKKNDITSELSLMFNDFEKEEFKKKKIGFDKSSTVEGSYFFFKSGARVKIQCYDWSEQTEKEKNWGDHLRIAIANKEYKEGLLNEANKNI